MSIVLRIILVVACVLTCAYTLRKIRKSQMQIEDSLYWILISFGLVIVSIFPELVEKFSELCGVGAPVNFVFLVMIFLLLLKVFLMSLKMSQMEDKMKKLVQRLTIQKYEDIKEDTESEQKVDLEACQEEWK
ncbi:MAG: DUF2304 domain-containing protein [Lachnospiraceae bacterium]|nr:DUF2304 domain-containing protein [Lachnospiraceae bacterium]